MYQIRQRLANIGAAFITICRNSASDKGLEKVLHFIHNCIKYVTIIYFASEVATP